MPRKAIAYTSDIILGRTGEVIKRQAQKDQIRQYAQENDIEIVVWFEDEQYDEEITRRPGVHRMLAFTDPVDCVLVERVWCFSRSWKKVRKLMDALHEKGVKLESCTWLWDCVSVLSRHHGRNPAPRHCAETVQAEEPQLVVQLEKIKIGRPARLHFVPQR
jgi:hypothetical protein